VTVTPSEAPRYLIPFDSSALPHLFTDVLVIGSGVAGLRAAIEAGRSARVTVVTKDELKESNTDRAQGGIAAVFGPDDSPADHAADTLTVGCGLSDPEAVEFVVNRGPDHIRELVDWGAAFDTDDGTFDLGREGGHGKPRVVHARGDATGSEVEATLIRRLAGCRNVRTLEHRYVLDLLARDGTCLGALTWSQSTGPTLIWANAVVLATGGAGQVFRETTNPPIATGDGVAMAYRAGCELRDLEFVQFHPTTLYVAGAARVLISEAARGEGGILVNKLGEPFMERYSPMKELAPRDVVSRAILSEMQVTGDTNVYLDLTHVPAPQLAARFPHIKELCSLFDIDITEDLIPVCPSAHYLIGGVATDLEGRTNLRRLFACGEVASTGLHGANRLGSNSLLEGLVFGKSTGAAAGAAAGRRKPRAPRKIEHPRGKAESGAIDLDDVRSSLRSAMWRNTGIVRNAQGLSRTLERIEFWCGYVLDRQFESPRGWRIQNMLTLADLIVRLALEREESRGVHYRSDFPEPGPEARHSAVRRPSADTD
jgi:L-aspartate oxidase